MQFAKWWTGYANFGLNHLQYSADFGKGKVIDLGVATWNGYLQQNFELKKWMSIELSGFYNSPSVWGGIFRNREMWSVDAGLKMKFLEERLSANLTVQDIFWTQKWRGDNQFGGLKITARGGWESRQVRMALVYRFGNRNAKGGRNRSSASSTEQNRVKK
jgi:iron complex outermembrane receptor protein